MARWTSKFVLGLLFVTFVFLSGCMSVSGQANAASEKTAGSKIIAMGDIHGDYDAYHAVMVAAGLIDEDGDWIGGKTIFVQTGDVADRGPDTRKIIEHLRDLGKQARKKGGKVITLVGNHEAMNMTADLRYVHAGEYEAFKTEDSETIRYRIYLANKEAIEAFYKNQDPELTEEAIRAKWEATSPLGKLEHQAAWGPKGDIGKWVVKNPAVVLVDGNLFAHGGFSQKYIDYSLKDINKAVKQALKAQDKSEESIINDSFGPLWYRGLVVKKIKDANDGAESEASVPTLTPEAEVESILAAYNAKRIIVGHTPETKGIKASYAGKLIQIDTGMSKYYNGTRSFLRIENGEIFAHDDGTIQKIN